MPRKKTPQDNKEARQKRDAKLFRQEVEVWDQDQIFHQWANNLAERKYRRGLWRPVTMAGRVNTLPQIPHDKKKAGVSLAREPEPVQPVFNGRSKIVQHPSHWEACRIPRIGGPWQRRCSEAIKDSRRARRRVQLWISNAVELHCSLRLEQVQGP